MLFERARFPHNTLTGTDISKEAIAIARKNERHCNSGARFLVKNALTPFSHRYDEVLCNLPFGIRVANHAHNLALYQSFFAALPDILKPDGYAFLFTHEKKLLMQCIDSFTLVARHTFSAGGLFPSVFVLRPN